MCNCITDTSTFRVLCLNEEVLKVSFQRMLAIRKKRRKPSREDFDNSARRWSAYSQFVFWIHEGPIGEEVRKLLPSCVYNTIRKEFPSVDGIYTDFQPHDSDRILID